ncbi:hypothetical protein OE09_1198 [Flavobacteriaceae bacterium MAR_2010_72]|nr:hypothetical protein OE09_1198 [Flavobacteriaceae bacterium MAR_2010_72]
MTSWIALKMKMKGKNSLIKIALAVLLFLCLLDMPYGYYQFIRFIALIVFGVLAFKANQEGEKTAMIIYGALALLFQPFFKIALGRELWNIVDVIVGIGLLLSIFYIKKIN